MSGEKKNQFPFTRVVRKIIHRLIPIPVTMYDSVTVSKIPTKAKAVAGYVNGLYTTFPKLIIAFPHARRLSISVNATGNAECLDIENGDASAFQAPEWVARQWARGINRPALYIEVSNAQSLLDILAVHGVPRKRVRLFTAHYTGVKHRCDSRCGFGFKDRADATQYLNTPDYDVSVCSSTFFD